MQPIPRTRQTRRGTNNILPMKKRPLSEEEIKIYQRNLALNLEEKEILEWERDNKRRSLDKGLEIAFKAMKRQTKSELTNINQRLVEVDMAIKDAEDKLANGATDTVASEVINNG